MATDSVASSIPAGESLNNHHQFRRNKSDNSRAFPSAWSQIVRGESESIPAMPSFSSSSSPRASATSASHVNYPESSPDSDQTPAKPENAAEVPDTSSGDNGGRTKKPAWNKPSNGVVEIVAVMDAVSWPALSESTRASPKSSSDSLKNLSEGSASQAPVITSSPYKSGSNANTNSNPNPNLNPNPNPNPNLGFTSRQKSMNKRNNGSPANGGSPAEMSHKVSEKPGAGMDTAASKDFTQKNNWETGSRSFGSQGHLGSDQPRNTFRRVSGPHMRPDGVHHNNYGNRVTMRDQDRVNYDWNSHRSFSSRDIHVHQPRVGPRGFIRQPATAPFINPPRGFGNPMGFPDMPPPVYYVPAAPPESIRGVPFVAPPPVMFYPTPDSQLRILVAKQIDYYFSTDNLIRDTFLRQNMDEQGWVHVSVIAAFNRVKMLTNNVQFILDALRGSSVVEVQGDKIRKRNDWMLWLLPPSQPGSASAPQSPVLSNSNVLTNHMKNLSLGEDDASDDTNLSVPSIDDNAKRVPSRSLSGDLNSLPYISDGFPTGSSADQIGVSSESSDQFASVRSSAKN